MQKLTRKDLYSLEQYAEVREQFRRRVIEHKKNRMLPIGPNATLYFEDRLTMQYQIQEMLRVERIFEPAAIEEELETYNPLIPDGGNLKATFMLEYPDAEQRRLHLAALIGIEHAVWLQVEGFDKVLAVADEDLERSTADKTASVHFMRFEFSLGMITALKDGVSLSAGIDHARYRYQVTPVAKPIVEALLADFDETAHETAQ